MNNPSITAFVKAIVAQYLGDDMEFGESVIGHYDSWTWGNGIKSNSKSWIVKVKGSGAATPLMARSSGALVFPMRHSNTLNISVPEPIQLAKNPNVAADIATRFLPNWSQIIAKARKDAQIIANRENAVRTAAAAAGVIGDHTGVAGPGGSIDFRIGTVRTVRIKLELEQVSVEEAGDIGRFLAPYMNAKLETT